MGTGSWPRVMAKAKHEAGDVSIIRVTGGSLVWMPADAAAEVRTGTRLLIAGGGLPLQGLEHLGVERAVLAGQQGLFEGEGDLLHDGIARDVNGAPLCPMCGGSMMSPRFGDVPESDDVEYFYCPACQEKWELVHDYDGAELYPTSSRKRGRQVLAGEPVNVGGSVEPVNVDGGPGVAMARAPRGFQVVLVNPGEEAAAAVDDALSGFGTATRAAENVWVIDTSEPFAGSQGPAYTSLVKLHRLISQRGVPPSLFRDLRDWVAGRS